MIFWHHLIASNHGHLEAILKVVLEKSSKLKNFLKWPIMILNCPSNPKMYEWISFKNSKPEPFPGQPGVTENVRKRSSSYIIYLTQISFWFIWSKNYYMSNKFVDTRPVTTKFKIRCAIQNRKKHSSINIKSFWMFYTIYWNE